MNGSMTGRWRRTPLVLKATAVMCGLLVPRIGPGMAKAAPTPGSQAPRLGTPAAASAAASGTQTSGASTQAPVAAAQPRAADGRAPNPAAMTGAAGSASQTAGPHDRTSPSAASLNAATAGGAAPEVAPAAQDRVQPDGAQVPFQQPVSPQAAPASGSPVGSTAPTSAASSSEAEIPIDLGEDPPAPETSPAGSDNVMPLLQLGLKLGAVLVLAYASLHILRRFVSGAARPGAPVGALHVRSTVPLGPGRSLHVVAMDGRELLVASTAQQVTLLTELTPPPAERQGGTDPGNAGTESFRQQLNRLSAHPGRGGRTAAANLGEPAAPDPRTLSDDELREEVRRKLLALNRGAQDRLRPAAGGGQDEPWSAR